MRTRRHRLAQPSPKTGTRSTSGRNPKRPATFASRLGVAIPVDEMVTMVSNSAASSSAASSALLPRRQKELACSLKIGFVRSGQPSGVRYQSMGRTASPPNSRALENLAQGARTRHSARETLVACRDIGLAQDVRRDGGSKRNKLGRQTLDT
jgi:hypothetical protein